MQIFYLIRHGETEWNRSGVFQGQLDVPLSDVGRRQAATLAPGLRRLPVTHVYASPLSRAHETARLLFPDREVTLLPELMERNLGVLQGLTPAEAERRYPGVWAQLNDLEGGPPGAESLGAFRDRVKSAFARMAGTHVAVVAHGGSIRALLEHALGFDRLDTPHPGRIRIDNTSLSVVARGEEGFTVRVINARPHLP
jgi:broad specificity phosphatase PhoE